MIFFESHTSKEKIKLWQHLLVHDQHQVLRFVKEEEIYKALLSLNREPYSTTELREEILKLREYTKILK